MTSLSSPNTIVMNINSLEYPENTNENNIVHTNVNFNMNVVNLNIEIIPDMNGINGINGMNIINDILQENNLNQTNHQSTTIQTRSSRPLPASIIIVSPEDEQENQNSQANIQTKRDKNIKLKSKTATKSSLKKIKNIFNKEIELGVVDGNVDSYNVSCKTSNTNDAKKKLTIYTYEQLKTEKYKMDELRKLCMQYKVSRAGNKEEIIKRLYEYCKNSIMPLRIQKVVRGFFHRKLINLRGPAFKNRNICTNETDFFTMDEMREIPYEQFYSYKDVDGFIYGFNILSLHNLIAKEGDNTKNPYNRNSISPSVKQDIRRIVKLSALLKSPIDIIIKNEIVDPRKRMEMKILELFQTINSYGNYANSEWFMELNHIGHIRFARELYDIWNYRAQLTNLKKYEICPPHGSPFLGTPYFTNAATNTTLVNLGYDVLIRFNVQIIENLIKSAIDVDNKTLGSFYVLTALTLVSEPARNAMPWLYEAGVYNGNEVI